MPAPQPLTDLRREFRRSRRLWLSAPVWKQRAVFWVGGAIVGLAAVAFAAGADLAYRALRQLLLLWPWLPLLLTPAGFALLVALTDRFFAGSQGSGIPQAIAARVSADPAHRRSLLNLRLAAGKVGLTLLGLLVGASVGREGPTVQVGASLFHELGRFSGRRYEGLILAGSAAGIAAAFNTPLAGIVFAIEELSRSFNQRTSGLVLTAVIVAGFVSLALVGNYTYFGHTAAALDRPSEWLVVPVCGVLGGIAGGLFSRCVIAMARGRPKALHAVFCGRRVLFAGCCGLLVALIGLAAGNTTYGTGYGEARGLLEGTLALPGWYGLAKLAATALSTMSGIPGGIFSPSLAVGAGLGAGLTPFLPALPTGAAPILGMASYFAGVVQAPITTIVIVLEMTDGAAMTLPLMATALLAYGISRLVSPEPIYHALSKQFLPVRTEPALQGEPR